MIDTKARKHSLSLLKKIDEEKLTNWHLEENWPKSKTDPAINCILRWLWTLYDDDKEMIMADTLSDDNRKIFDRCSDFLKSDTEFITLTLKSEEEAEIRKLWGKEWRCDCTLPKDDDWPFPK